MSDTRFDTALSALDTPQDGKSLLKALATIRREVDWPRHRENIERLRAKGWLKQLVKVLGMQKNFVDLSLSILGNCIMDKGCARDVIGIYNILTPLGQLLKRYPDEDSVNGRVFRIIGNMCHHKDQWANIIIDRKPVIVSSIVDVIKKVAKDSDQGEQKFSDATVLMGVRALRVLLNSCTIIPLVKTFEVLKAVGALFIKLSEEWQESGKNEQLLHNIIRLLHDYSRYKCYHSILHMRSTERGDSLLHLSNVLLLAPKKIVKIIMNFIKISQLKSELPIPEICDKFVDEVLKHLNAREPHGDCTEYIQCLCYMLDDPSNRHSERCGRCLPVLIKFLQELKNPSDVELELCILLLGTLNKCAYDDALIQEQLKCDVVRMLLKKLHWLVGDSDTIDREHKRKKQSRNQLFIRRLEWMIGESEPVYGKRRKCLCMDTTTVNNGFQYPDLLSPQPPQSPDEIFKRQYSPCSSDDEISFINTSRFDRSPSPCSSVDSSPSCSSPQSVPAVAAATDSDSDDYSPVCSEADSNEFLLNDNDDGSDKVMSVEGSDDEEGSDELKPEDSAKELKVRLIAEITNLVRALCKVRPPLPQLGSEELLLALLKCSEFLNPALGSCISPIEAINKILESPEYLIPLMTNRFIETVHDLTKMRHKGCSTCVNHVFVGKFILKRLSCLAESEMGKGDVAHRLLRGTSDQKEQLVLVIPYIVRNKAILAKLMVNCGGLKILMQLLHDETSLKDRTCKVLCAMASKNLEIANPTEVAISFGKKKVLKIEKYKLNEDCPNVVTFKLDDGSSLEADREFLCENSDFFGRLLNGHFKESGQDEISLPNVNPKSLRCLLQLLKYTDHSLDLEIRLDLETLLDVIVLSDRYLMPDLCGSLINSVEKFRISTKTVPTIYRWSLESGTNLLRVESVAYALVANIDDNERLRMFQNLFDIGYSNELLEDIHKLLVRYLGSFAK